MSMAFFVHFDADGAITQVGMCPEPMLGSQHPPDGGGQIAIPAHPSDPGDFIKRNCVVNGDIVPKTEMFISLSTDRIAANGSSAAIIRGIPPGATADITGCATWGPAIVTDGELTLTSNATGQLCVTIKTDARNFHWSRTIHAH